MPPQPVIDLTNEDENSQSPSPSPPPPPRRPRTQQPPLMPRGFTEVKTGYLELNESSEDDSDPTPLPSSRKSNPQPSKGTPRNAKENASTSSPAIPKIVPSKAPSSLPVPPRGRQRSGQSFNSGSGSVLAEFAISTPRRAPKTLFPHSSGPLVKQSPQTLSQSINQKRPSSKSNVEDDSLFPSERAGNVPRSSRRGSPQGKRIRSESTNSADATPRSSSRLAVKSTIFSRPVGKSSPAIEKSKTQSLPSTRRAPSDKEDSTYESESASESEEETIDPTLGDNDIPVPLHTPSKRSSLRNAASQKSIPDIDPPPEDNDVPLPGDSPPRRISRSNASQRSIPDSIADSAGLSSPLRTRKDKSTLQVPQPSSDARKRNESPRDVIRRNKGKEREPIKEQQAQTISQLEESLRAFQQNMNDDHALTVRHLLRDAREAETAREQTFVDAESPFASLKGGIQIPSKDPVPRGAQAEQFRSFIAMKGKGASTNKLSESKTWLVPKKIKSDLSRVPKYSSHTFVRRNILSADDEKLRFVPYLGDVDTKESNKRRLENQLAEAYTAQNSEPIRVSEELANLRGHLDWWLEDLDIGCTKQTLEHYVLSQEDDMDEAGLGKKARKVLSKSFGPQLTNEKLLMAEKFSRAFENVFEFSLAKVLLPADRLKEMMEAAKKSPRKSLDSNPTKSLTAHLETYATLTCLICGAIECQTHGYYECPPSPTGNDSDDGADPPPDYQYEKKQVSMHPDEMIRRYEKRLAPRPKSIDAGDIGMRGESCGKQCYQLVDARNDYEFSQKQKDELRNYLFAWEEPESRSCDLSIAMGVPCWQLYEEIEKIELDRYSRSPEQSLSVKAKRPDWYDNKRKTLKQGFEDMTKAHRHEMRFQINPCAHPGRPCDAECPCVQADVLCERMCSCLDDCPRKFTGCGCSSYGRACASDTCICIQLNRECGPQCTSCGAVHRLDPRNKYDDRLFTSGCQNLALSRGVAKGLIMGESQLEGTGFGLYAAEPIRKGEFVSEYGGEIISTNEADRRGIVYDRKYLSFLFDLNGDVAIDAARLGNKTRFINHADNEKDGLNCEAKILFVNGEHRIKFITLRDVKAGEELLFNYGKKFAEKHGLSKKLPKIKEGAKKGVVPDEHLDALDGIDSGKRQNARGDMRGMNGRGKAGRRGRGKARKTAPTHEVIEEPEPEPEVEDEDAEMPDVDDDSEDEYEEDGEPRKMRPRRRRMVPARYTR